MQKRILPDGTTLEFPDEIPENQVDFLARREMEKQNMGRAITQRVSAQPNQQFLPPEPVRYSPQTNPPPQGELRTEAPWYARALKPTLETAGLLGGGALGGASGLLTGPGAPVASPVGAVAGAGLGYSMGRQAADRLLEMMGYKESVTGKPVATPGVAGVESLKDIGVGAGLEMGGRIGGRAIEGGIRTMLGEATTATESLIQTYKDIGVKPLPSDVAPHKKSLRLVESALGYRPLAGDVMEQKALERMEKLVEVRRKMINNGMPPESLESIAETIKSEIRPVLDKWNRGISGLTDRMVEDFSKKIGLTTRARAGATFSEVLESDRFRRSDEIKNLYSKVQGGLPQKGWDEIPISKETVDTAQKALDLQMSALPSLRDQNTIKVLNEVIELGGGKLPKGLPEGAMSPEMLALNPELASMLPPPSVGKPTWLGMDMNRSKLNERVADILNKPGGQPTRETMTLSNLAQAINRDMESFAEKTGGDVWRSMLKAREASRTMHELYDKDVLRIMQKSPEQIIDRILNNKEVTLIKQINEAVGDKGMNPLRQAFFTRTLQRATKKDVLDPRALAKELRGIDQDALDIIVTPEQKMAMYNIVSRNVYLNTRKDANKFYHFMESIVDANSSRAVHSILDPNNTEYIAMAKKILPDETLKKMQAKAVEETLRMSSQDLYLPVTSSKEFIGKERMLAEILPADQYSKLKSFMGISTNMRSIESLAKNVSLPGQVLLTSQIGSSILRSPERAFGLLGVPYFISKVYASDMAMNALIKAVRMNPTSKEAHAMFMKFYMKAADEAIRENPELADIPIVPKALY